MTWEKVSAPSKKSYRKYNNRNIYRRRMNNHVGIAMKAYDIAKYVRSMINVEKKFIDTSQVATAVTDTGTIYPLTLMPQGTTANDRTGLSIKAISNNLKWELLLNTTDSIVRAILFIEDNSRGTAPAVTDVLSSYSAGLGCLAPYNKINAGTRFRMIYDQVITLNTQNYSNRHLSKFHKLNHHLKYLNLAAGSQATAQNGQLYLLLVSDQATAINQPTVTFINRFQYVDN